VLAQVNLTPPTFPSLHKALDPSTLRVLFLHHTSLPPTGSCLQEHTRAHPIPVPSSTTRVSLALLPPSPPLHLQPPSITQTCVEHPIRSQGLPSVIPSPEHNPALPYSPGFLSTYSVPCVAATSRRSARIACVIGINYHIASVEAGGGGRLQLYFSRSGCHTAIQSSARGSHNHSLLLNFVLLWALHCGLYFRFIPHQLRQTHITD
jgi:hypothetical protein